MFKRFLAPFLLLSVVLTGISFIGLNSEVLAQKSERNQDYFIKSIPPEKLVVIEPNYGRFYNPNPEIKGDSSGQVLYDSLDELGQIYQIENTKMIRFERKGQMIPNLYVTVDSLNMQESLAYGLEDK